MVNVYYTATIDGTSVTLADISVSQEMFTPGRFSLTLENDQSKAASPNFDVAVGGSGTAAQGKDVIISRKGTALFTGVVDQVRVSNERMIVSGQGNAIKLAYDTADEWEEFVATGFATVANTLLSGTGITLGDNDFVGTNVSVAFQEGDNIFRSLYGTVKNYLGGECDVNSSNEFNAVTSLGTDKSATVALEHGTNIISLERIIDSMDLKNWVKVRGVSEGPFALTSGPAEDAASQAAYGTRKLVVDARSAYFQDELDNIKTNTLADTKDPKDTLERVLFIDDSDFGLVIGDTVTITNARLGVSGTYRIFGLRHRWGTNGEIVTATISNTANSVGKEIANMSYRLDIEKFYPQGSPMVSNFGLTGPFAIDDSEDITFDFDIPDVSDWDVTIHDCFISIYGSAYRIWSSGAASGGGSTSGSGGAQTPTSSSEDSHTHIGRTTTLTSLAAFATMYAPVSASGLLGVLTPAGAGQFGVDFASDSHEHTVSIANHNHSTPDHTHTAIGSISVTSDFPVDVEVWVNGTKVADKVSHPDLAGGAAFSVRKIDIKDEVVTGKNTVVLKSTGANSLGMLAAPGFYRVFARSRSS